MIFNICLGCSPNKCARESSALYEFVNIVRATPYVLVSFVLCLLLGVFYAVLVGAFVWHRDECAARYQKSEIALLDHFASTSDCKWLRIHRRTRRSMFQTAATCSFKVLWLYISVSIECYQSKKIKLKRIVIENNKYEGNKIEYWI